MGCIGKQKTCACPRASARHIDTERRRRGGWLLLSTVSYFDIIFPTPTKEDEGTNVKRKEAIIIKKSEEEKAHTEIGGTFQSLVAILVVRS